MSLRAASFLAPVLSLVSRPCGAWDSAGDGYRSGSSPGRLGATHTHPPPPDLVPAAAGKSYRELCCPGAGTPRLGRSLDTIVMRSRIDPSWDSPEQ
jgi:hypothetical protein